MRKKIFFLALATALVLVSTDILAGTSILPTSGTEGGGEMNLGAVADKINGTLQDIRDMLGGLAYIVGAVMAFKAVIGLRDHSESPQQVKLSKPLTYIFMSGAFFALPSFMGKGVESLFGGNATAVIDHGTTP